MSQDSRVSIDGKNYWDLPVLNQFFKSLTTANVLFHQIQRQSTCSIDPTRRAKEAHPNYARAQGPAPQSFSASTPLRAMDDNPLPSFVSHGPIRHLRFTFFQQGHTVRTAKSTVRHHMHVSSYNFTEGVRTAGGDHQNHATQSTTGITIENSEIGNRIDAKK